MEALKSRKAGVWLHWASATLLLGMAAAGTEDMRRAAAWLFAAVVGAWVARTLLAGPMARPGTGLSGAAAAAHLAIHRGLLALAAATAAVGIAAPGPLHDRLVQVTLGAAALHVAFNLWREASGAKVLRRMLP